MKLPPPLPWIGRHWQPIQRVLDELGEKRIGIMAAGIAYYGVLGFFPMIVVLVSIGSLVLSPADIQEASQSISQLLPSSISSLLTTQLNNAESHPLGNALTAIVAIVIAIFGASGAVSNLMGSLNIMYRYEETRNFFKRKLLSMALTLGMILGMIIMISLIFASGDVLKQIGVNSAVLDVLSTWRWLVMVAAMMIGLGVLYHFGPSHPKRKPWNFMSWGAIAATVIWLIASLLFFWYTRNIAHLARSYSLFAGVIGLMLWLNVSSYIVLLGAELNYRRERHKARNT